MKRKNQKRLDNSRPVDLRPDGVFVIIPWGAMEPGWSVFVPCIDTELATSQVMTISQRLGAKFSVRTRIERGFLGIRIWRRA